MKNRRVSVYVSLATIAIAGLVLGRGESAGPQIGEAKISVLNPAVASKMAERLPLAPRPATLDGKTVYMVNINWGGSETARSIFDEMQVWFSQNMPGVKTAIRLKRGGYDADDPALWKEIAQNGNAAILGVSG